MTARRAAQRHDALAARVVASFPLRDASGRHVRAGSALVRVGARLLAVQDDALAAAWIDPHDRSLEAVVLAGSGGALSKADKPDFEAALVHDGAVWVLGSGTTAQRRRIARLAVDGAPVLLDCTPLYAAIEGRLGMAPNIEGALAVGDRLRLFHRGPGRRRDANFTVDVPLAVLTGAAPRILDTIAWDLGMLGGLHLGFTDAAARPDGAVLYLAVAEDTPDGIADGPIAGAAIGFVTDTDAHWAPLLEVDGRPSTRKMEGLALDADGAGGWLLTDPDDPAQPAELCRLDLKET